MSIESDAVNKYNKNLQFLKINHNKLYKKLELFDIAIQSGLKEENLVLEYKEDAFFDIFDKVNNSWMYEKNSIKYSEKRVEEVNFSSKINCFKTFYEYKYSEDIIEKSKSASILLSREIGNAPILGYVNNLKKENDLKIIYKFFVFGVGLGIHLPLLEDKLKAKNLVVIEPSLELFRLSLFVTDYQSLSKITTLNLFIGLNEPEFLSELYPLLENNFIFDQYIKFFMFSGNCDFYVNILQNYLVSRSHLLFSYERELMSLKRTYEYLYEEYNFIDISKQYKNDFFLKPVLLLAAGPSLQKNIEFVKNNQDKYIIVAIYATLPLLEKNKIVPDIITQYDEQEEVVLATAKKLKDLEFFSDSIFLFSSHVHKEVINLFPKRKIFIYQAFHEAKSNYGTLTSPTIGEITYALTLIFNSKKIYLLGLDLALTDDKKTHIDTHDGANAYKNIEESSNEKFSYKKNIIKIKGNLKKEVLSLPVFKSSIVLINLFTQKYKNEKIEVYNLSDGAYFENIIALKIDELNIGSFELLNKCEIRMKLKESFLEISSSSLREEDINYLLKKEESLDYFLKELEFFHIARKFSSIDSFQKEFIVFWNKVFSSNILTKDLESILLNYYKHSLPAIFYLINLKKLNNPKKHIKYLNKNLYRQVRKIVDEYLNILKHKKT